jgi:hypothetical protein
MTPLTDAADQASVITPPPQAPAGNRKCSLAGVLADPRVRLGAGTAALLATAIAVRRDRVGACETAAFRAVNGLPGWLYPPAWAIMQLGALGAAPAAAGSAWLAGDRELAGRLLAGGTSAWALSKAAKRMVQRPRPATLYQAPAAAAPKPPVSGTCPGTPGSPSPWAPPPCPVSARPAAPSPSVPFPSWA